MTLGGTWEFTGNCRLILDPWLGAGGTCKCDEVRSQHLRCLDRRKLYVLWLVFGA
jgi:hypothetical protein